jgi:hypothetical protein
MSKTMEALYAAMGTLSIAGGALITDGAYPSWLMITIGVVLFGIIFMERKFTK